MYQGASTSDIALQLNISPNAVDKHRENIMRKLHVSNAVQLIDKVRQLELFSQVDSKDYS